MLDRTRKKLVLNESADTGQDDEVAAEQCTPPLEAFAKSKGGQSTEVITAESGKQVWYSAFNNSVAVCAIGPMTLVDFGYSAVHCAAISVMISAIVPVMVLKFVDKVGTKLCVQGWFIAVFTSLIVASLIGALQEGVLFKALHEHYNLPITTIFFVVCVLVQNFLPWGLQKLWASFGK